MRHNVPTRYISIRLAPAVQGFLERTDAQSAAPTRLKCVNGKDVLENQVTPLRYANVTLDCEVVLYGSVILQTVWQTLPLFT